jgi:hypothetical protein
LLLVIFIFDGGPITAPARIMMPFSPLRTCRPSSLQTWKPATSVASGSTSAKNAAVVYPLRSNGALDNSFGDGASASSMLAEIGRPRAQGAHGSSAFCPDSAWTMNSGAPYYVPPEAGPTRT